MSKEIDFNTALWSQGVSETDSDFFVINGVPSRYSGETRQNAVLGLMNTGLFSILRKHRDGESTTPCFVVKRNNKWFYIEGNFNEKDTADRLRVYRYITNLKKQDEIVQTLTEYAKKIGCTINENDLKQLKKNLKNTLLQPPFRKYLILACVIIVIVIVTLFKTINRRQHSNDNCNNSIEIEQQQ